MRQYFCVALILTTVCEATDVPRADVRTPQALSTEPRTGPGTEDRFPPLKVPEGFHVTLFACDPLVKYPSVIAIGPRTGSLFVAHDYLTGLGVEIVRRDEIRLIEDTDDDGYADQSTKYAGEFNSIQGLAYHDGSIFVMHAPLLTRLRDIDGDGVADERRDLISGLGLPPEENNNRLHCANGVVAGHDGWLYLALGDRGCDVRRPEEDRLQFQQGGILRCRTDGSNLHVFATGLRNIYDVVLDDELNVFVRDNENDGGDYMIRVCHCFFGSDHGYPYHYYERPDEPMPPLADLGRGSSAGGTSYLETAFPSDYRNSLYFCEWGRGVVRYARSRKGSSFGPMTEIDFAIGAQNDPYGFKPTDLVVDYDGSILVSDWCDGQRPKRGRGRIYRISYVKSSSVQSGTDTNDHTRTTTSLIQQLNADSYHSRVAAQIEIQKRGTSAQAELVSSMNSGQLGPHARLHALWIIARTAQNGVPEILLDLAESDPEAAVQAQAIRAIGDLTDPVLINRRISGGRGDERIAGRIASVAAEKGTDPRIILEALIVMSRLGWSTAPNWIERHLKAVDPALSHAAQQALRNARSWPAVTGLLNTSVHLRNLALHAVAEQRVTYLAEQLMERLKRDKNPEHRREYADALTRIVRKPEPWTYWGFRPGPRPAATVNWEKTASIVTALNVCLNDPSFDVRAFVLDRMLREEIVPEISRLTKWLGEDTSEQRVMAILKSLEHRNSESIQSVLTHTVLRRDLSDASRLAAVSMLVDILSDDDGPLLRLAAELDDGPVLASVLYEFGRRPGIAAKDLLIQKLDSEKPAVQVAAMRSLAQRKDTVAVDHIERLLAEANSDVRLAAVEAAGQLGAVDSKETLLDFTTGSDRVLTAACLDALRQLHDGRAVPVAAEALSHRTSQFAAMKYLKSFGTTDQMAAVVQAAARNPASDFQHQAVETLVEWHRQFVGSREQTLPAIATIHGDSGQPLFWYVCGPLPETVADQMLRNLKSFDHDHPDPADDVRIRTVLADGIPASLRLNQPANEPAGSVWLAWTPVRVNSQTQIEILTSAPGRLKLWLNGEAVLTRDSSAGFLPDSERFPASLKRDTNLLAAEIRPDADEPAQFQLRFRRRSSQAEHERLIAYALRNPGQVDRGREVFKNAEKSTCVRCHRLGPEGGRIGPDLTGIGSRFSRIHLIESILEPSRSVAPSYSTVTVALNDGKVVSGIRVSESDQTLVLGDNQGRLHEIATEDVVETADQTVSTMPEGLEKKMTPQEFTDLLAFLESEKSSRGK